MPTDNGARGGPLYANRLYCVGVYAPQLVERPATLIKAPTIAAFRAFCFHPSNDDFIENTRHIMQQNCSQYSDYLNSNQYDFLEPNVALGRIKIIY